MLSHKGYWEVTLLNVDYCNPPVITRLQLLRGADSAFLLIMRAHDDKLLQPRAHQKATQNTLHVTQTALFYM